MLLTVDHDGWAAVRNRVLSRDYGCVFRNSAIGGVCGGPLELDHVKQNLQIGAPIVKRRDKHSYKAPDDEAHLVSVCANHHRHLGIATSKAGREFERDYLAERYPEVWGGFPNGRERAGG